MRKTDPARGLRSQYTESTAATKIKGYKILRRERLVTKAMWKSNRPLPENFSMESKIVALSRFPVHGISLSGPADLSFPVLTPR